MSCLRLTAMSCQWDIPSQRDKQRQSNMHRAKASLHRSLSRQQAYHLFFSYFSWRNSFTFCGSLKSGIDKVRSSWRPSQICLQTWKNIKYNLLDHRKHKSHLSNWWFWYCVQKCCKYEMFLELRKRKKRKDLCANWKRGFTGTHLELQATVALVAELKPNCKLFIAHCNLPCICFRCVRTWRQQNWYISPKVYFQF